MSDLYLAPVLLSRTVNKSIPRYADVPDTHCQPEGRPGRPVYRSRQSRVIRLILRFTLTDIRTVIKQIRALRSRAQTDTKQTDTVLMMWPHCANDRTLLSVR